jgi:tRNA-specific 2-thiouridylase
MIAARERVVVAMSGGVDSTVAAALLVERGCEVIGVTLRLLQGEETAGDAVHEARAAADRLGIAHHVLDGRREFEELVLRRSWDEYARGRTPNPCVVCNARIKFGLLLDHARSLGATKIATGHYARLDATPTIRRGVDRRKDQSYFLWALDARQLAAVLFPLGELTKQQVRDRARSLGLPNAERAESQDACFVRDDQQFAEELRRHFGEPARSGVIVDEAGKVLGAHQGIHHFTIGQRRGWRRLTRLTRASCWPTMSTRCSRTGWKPAASYGTLRRATNQRLVKCRFVTGIRPRPPWWNTRAARPCACGSRNRSRR